MKVLIAALVLGVLGVGATGFGVGRVTGPRVIHYGSENSQVLVCHQPFKGVYDCVDYIEFEQLYRSGDHGL